MVSIGCFFRGNYMLAPKVRRLLSNFCKVAELVPEFWNVCEPISKPFDRSLGDDVVQALVGGGIFSSILVSRKVKPRYWGTITLRNGPRSRPQHNGISVYFEEPWVEGGRKLSDHVLGVLEAELPDYGYVADASENDYKQFAELCVPFPPAEMFNPERRAPPFIGQRRRDGVPVYWFRPSIEQGPQGYLWDVVWFNYFGKPYVELIGKEKLRSAGWARVEEMGGGLACFATEGMEDPSLLDRRAKIRAALGEFFWTPGCKPKDKKAPVFDFSEQICAQAAQPEQAIEPGARFFTFAGLSEEEKAQAIKQIEQGTGMVYDREKGILQPKKNA